MSERLLTVPDASSVAVSVRLAPHFTSLALLIGALRPGSTGLPDPWVSRIGRELPGHTLAGLGMLRDRVNCDLADFMVPADPGLDQSLDDAIDTVWDTADDAVVGDVLSLYDDAVPAFWRPTLHSPRRWLGQYVAAERAVAPYTQQLWETARPLFDREVHRIGTATVRGTLDVLLNTLSPDISYLDEVLTVRPRVADHYTASREVHAVLGGRPIVLAPMICGHRFKLVNFALDDAVWISYPLPGREALWESGPDRRTHSELEDLVGPVRTTILLALTRPQSMGELARRTRLAPSALSFHCARLESAGLVSRHRAGRAVEIARTQRGEQLIELLGPS